MGTIINNHTTDTGGTTVKENTMPQSAEEKITAIESRIARLETVREGVAAEMTELLAMDDTDIKALEKRDSRALITERYTRRVSSITTRIQELRRTIDTINMRHELTAAYTACTAGTATPEEQQVLASWAAGHMEVV